MSVRVSQQVWDRFSGNKSELLCLLALADFADDDGYCFPSIETVARKIRGGVRQTQRLMHKLIESGYVEVVGNLHGGAPGATRRYRLIFPAATGVIDVTPTSDTHDIPTGDIHDADGCRSYVTQTVIEPSTNKYNATSIRFGEFWSAYPNSKRKGSRGKCEAMWKSKKLDKTADIVIAHVRQLALSDDWRRSGGQFIPAPLVYLNQDRWDGAEIEGATGGDERFEGAL